MQYIYQKLLCLLLLGSTTLTNAQISSGGSPLSFDPVFRAQHGDNILPAVSLPAATWQQITNVTKAQTAPDVRIAAPIQTDLGLDNAGQWTVLENGDRLWRLKIRSEGAQGLMALYDKLYLPFGAKLFMYSEDGKQILGAYTDESNTPSGKFVTGFIKGATAIIEYFEPFAVRGQGKLHIFRVDYAFKKIGLEKDGLSDESGFGTSSECNININCQQGLNWQSHKKGICRIVIVLEEGSGYCTGNVINNTANDAKPYILTSYHVQDGYTPLYDMWRYDFNYETEGCTNPQTEPSFQSILGSVLRASRRENDFLLLELIDPIPTEYNVYYMGWSRAASTPSSGTTIHHPKGDIKKIARRNQAITIQSAEFAWSNGFTSPPEYLWRVRYDEGIFEPGSSGAGLLDQSGRLVGQLHGGHINCSQNQTTAYYDRLSLSWEGGGTPETRLKDWLDPINTNQQVLDGMFDITGGLATISGYVLTEDGKGIAGVAMQLFGNISATTLTDTSGKYTFEKLPVGENFGISLTKDDNDRNGVTTFDLVLISKHLLGIQKFDSPFKILAADVNDSKNLTTLDLIILRKLILNIDIEFESVPSWRFLPDKFEFSDPENPYQDFLPTVFFVPNFNSNVLNFNFVGWKYGDVNNTADPKQ